MVDLTKSSTFEDRKTKLILPEIKKQVHELYGNRIRLRACGVLIEDDRILMLKHEGIGELNYYWSVPGGEPIFEENLAQAIKREFEEETKIKVEVKNFLHLNEYIEKPLHAIEMYFRVEKISGTAQLGTDPESADFSVLTAIKWLSKEELIAMSDKTRPHFLEKIWY